MYIYFTSARVKDVQLFWLTFFIWTASTSIYENKRSIGKVQKGNAWRRLGRTKEKNEKVTARQGRKNEKYTVVQTQAGPTYCFLAAGAPSVRSSLDLHSSFWLKICLNCRQIKKDRQLRNQWTVWYIIMGIKDKMGGGGFKFGVLPNNRATVLVEFHEYNFILT